eukprot:4762357-Pyramimonas_sp.AAC.1
MLTLQDLDGVPYNFDHLRLSPHDAAALPHVDPPQLPQTLRIGPPFLRGVPYDHPLCIEGLRTQHPPLIQSVVHPALGSSGLVPEASVAAPDNLDI